MKSMLYFLLNLIVIINLTGCTGDSGGTTSDPTPVPTPTPNPGPTFGSLNTIQSRFQVFNNSGVEVSSIAVNEPIKIRLTAKDEFGNLLTGLNIKFARLNSSLPDLVPTEISSGVYEINYSYNDQVYEEFVVLKDNSSVSMSKIVSISFCNGSSNITASPFHNTAIKNSETYYIICNASQLAQAGNFLTRNYILGNNIDLNSYYIDGNSDQIPDNQFRIGSDVSGYSGKFLGYNLTISNFKYISSTNDNVGFFGKIISGAVIKDFNLSLPKVSGLNKVGNLAGSIEITSASNIEILGVSVLTGDVTTSIGNLHGGFSGLIDGTASTGLISLSNITALTSINLNSSSGIRSQIGGFSGLIKKASLSQSFINSSITYNDKSGTISDIGGAFGKIELTSTSISNISLNSTMTVNKGTNIGGFAGSAVNVNLSNNTNNAITMNQLGSLSNDVISSGGLFGKISSSTITNISGYVLASNIRNSFGSFANTLENSTSNKAIIGGTINFNSDNVGGLYSLIDNSTLIKNLSYVGLTSTNLNSFIGGLVALSKNASVIQQSSFEGSVTASSSMYIGGIVASTEDNLQITNVSSKGNLTGDSQVAGLVTQINNAHNPNSKIDITTSFVSGTLIGNSEISGLVGDLKSNSTLTQSFSVPTIKTASNGVPSNSSSITINKESLNSVVSDTYYLSSYSLNANCSSPGCLSNFSVTDTFTGSSSDINYYYNISNAPMSNWNFTTIWESFGLFPILRL